MLWSVGRFNTAVYIQGTVRNASMQLWHSLHPTHPMRQEMLLIRPDSLSTSQRNKSEVDLESKTSASNCNTWATTCIGRRVVHNESYKRLNFIQLKSQVKTLPVLRITGHMSVANLLYLTGQIQAFLVTFQVQFTVIHVVWVHGHHISGRLSL